MFEVAEDELDRQGQNGGEENNSVGLSINTSKNDVPATVTNIYATYA